MTKIYEFQEAVYTRLSANQELMEKIAGVFDSIPSEKPFPYIILGRAYSTPVKTKTTDGEQIELTLDIWSGSKGKKETIQLIKLVETALTEDLIIDSTHTLDQSVKSREVLEEVNDLYHGTVVFEILLDLE